MQGESHCPGCQAIEDRRVFGGHEILRCEMCGQWWRVFAQPTCGCRQRRLREVRLHDGSDGAECGRCGVRCPVRALRDRHRPKPRRIGPDRLPNAAARARIIAALDMAMAGEVELTSVEASHLHLGLKALLDRVYAARRSA